MNQRRLLAAFILSCVLFASCGNGNTTNNEEQTVREELQNAPDSQKRIVSLTGAITEIVSALGHENWLVARDVTSIYPESVKKNVKDLGHVRTLTIEPIVAEKPDLILASNKDMNPDLLGKIKESGISHQIFDQEFSVEGTKTLIREVARELGNKNHEQLIANIDESVSKMKTIENKPSVLFIYARGAGTLLVAGDDTPMASMIEIAGGTNAAKGIDGFKPLTPEALLQSNPDVILMFDDGFASIGGENGLLKLPGIEKTNAGKNKNFIQMNAAFLASFGPRVGEAALALNNLLAERAK